MSDHIPLAWLFTALAVMLLVAGFFSIAETSMMALNRNRLKHLVREGRRSARLAQAFQHSRAASRSPGWCSAIAARRPPTGAQNMPEFHR